MNSYAWSELVINFVGHDKKNISHLVYSVIKKAQVWFLIFHSIIEFRLIENNAFDLD